MSLFVSVRTVIDVGSCCSRLCAFFHSANIKQVLTILLAVSVFNVHVTPINSIGILLTLAGGACYAVVEYSEGKGKKRPTLGESFKNEKYRALLIPGSRKLWDEK